MSAEKESEELEEMIRTLHLSALSMDQEPLGRSAADQAELLTRIRIAQSKNENLNKVVQNDNFEQSCSKRFKLFIEIKFVKLFL